MARTVTAEEARTLIGLNYTDRGSIKPGAINPPMQVGFAVRGSDIPTRFDTCTPSGSIERVDDDQARIVRPAIRIFEPLNVTLVERQQRVIASSAHCAGRR